MSICIAQFHGTVWHL